MSDNWLLFIPSDIEFQASLNPNIHDLSPEQELESHETLGHKLRKVWVHL